MDSAVLDMDAVYTDLDDFIQKQEYDVRCFGYDPYNAREFIERWSRDNGEYGVEKIIQGSKTESVPLGEIKNSVKRDILTLIRDYSLLQWVTVLQSRIQTEIVNFLKNTASKKIDAVSALMDAYVVYKVHKDDFY